MQVDEGMGVGVLLKYLGEKLTARADNHFVNLQSCIILTDQGDISEVLVLIEVLENGVAAAVSPSNPL